LSDDEDVKAWDIVRELEHFIKMHLQQLLTRLQQRSTGGGEVAPASASLDLELRL
jgi:hypothetical protein